MFLFINNLENQTIVLGFKAVKNIFWLRIVNKKNRNEKILLGINGFLKKQGKKLSCLKGIIVINGPGSFAGIRVALSVANTLSWSLNIPVIGVKLNKKEGNEELFEKGLKKINKIKKFKVVKPLYGKLPNISEPKKKI